MSIMSSTLPFTLSKQPSGFEAKIKSLSGPKHIIERLLEFGFVEGQTFKIISKMPFGDPYVVSIKNSTVALRKEELECIQV